MVLEMKRALEELKSGNTQGYRRLYDATYEEIYCRSLLIIQKEEYVLEYIRDFYKDVFGALDEADDASDVERWFLHRYYQKLRKHYHRLLEKQEKAEADAEKTLASVPAAFPLLHRIMMVMSFQDDFSAAEISAIYGLAEEKIQSELGKLEKLLPTITKDRPESEAAYLGSWKMLLLGASRQVVSEGSGDWVDSVYADAAKSAGVSAEPVRSQPDSDDFEYFVADPEPEPEKPKKKVIPLVKEEPEEEEDEYEDEEEEDDEYEDEYDDDEDDEDDDRYDWDMEDDGKKMIILGIVLAVIIVAIVGIVAFRILGKDGDSKEDPVQTEQEAEEDENKLIIKGEGEDTGEPEPEETPEETPEEEPEEAEEPEALVMRVSGNSINIRSESNTDSDILTKVKKDEKVEVLGDPSGEWVQIRCIEQNNEEGYMMSQYLSNIE